MVFFRSILLFLFVFPFLLTGQTADRRASELLVMRMRQSAETMIPRTVSGLPKEQTFQIQLPEKGENSGFTVRNYAGGTIVELPARFPDWAFSSERLFRTAEQILRARLGTNGKFRDSWAAAAVVRSSYFPGEAFGTTGFTQAGYAKIMTGHGIFPNLSVLLDSPAALYMSPGMTAGAWTDWAVSLYELGVRSRAFRTGAAEQYFAARNSGKKGNLFEKYLLQKLAESNPVYRRRRDIPPQEWFETALSRLYLSQVNACSPENCERIFHAGYAEAVRILHSAPAAKLKREDHEALARTMMKLNALAMIAPSPAALKIIAALRTLERIRGGLSEAMPEDAVVQAERQVCQALGERSAVEQFLRQAERRLVSPATRFELTFRTMDREQPDTSLYREAHAMLNRYEQGE